MSESSGAPDAGRDRPSERPEPDQVGGAIWWHSRTRYLFARELAPGKQVLDLACANGFGTTLLAEVATSAVGADVSAAAVETARRLNARANVRYEVVASPTLPFGDASFDLVVCLETIEHLAREAQPSFVRELVRVLRPEGVLVLSTPDRDTERAHALMTAEPNPWHLHTPSRAELGELLAALPHRVELVEHDLVATALLPADPEARLAKLGAPTVAWGVTDRPAPISVVHACARTEAAIAPARAARLPVAYRGDHERLAFIAHVLSSARLPNLSGLPVDEQVAFVAERLGRVEAHAKDVETRHAAQIDRLNRNVSVRGVIDRLLGRS